MFCAMRFRLNKAYLILGLTAIFVLAALLSGPVIRKRAREKAARNAPAAAPQGQPATAEAPEQEK
jgi:flagellar biosynthesis/type III secretory pathway M-ring protein FliF/YscJ